MSIEKLSVKQLNAEDQFNNAVADLIRAVRPLKKNLTKSQLVRLDRTLRKLPREVGLKDMASRVRVNQGTSYSKRS